MKQTLSILLLLFKIFVANGQEEANVSFRPQHMRTIYIFSGLGADERVFKNLKFTGFKPVFVHWIPAQNSEPIGEYARRISKQITSEDAVLIGLSFGGIMAIEVSKHIRTKQVILISSVKTHKEIPVAYRIFAMLGLHKLLPISLLKKPGKFNNQMFGTKSPEDEKLLAEILHDTDPTFFKWALNQLLTWKNDYLPDNFTHIHGTDDQVLPFSSVKSDYKIVGGGHFMVLNRSKEIDDLLQKLIVE